MNIEHLVKMANQIGDFYNAESDRKEAVQNIASHLKRFWEPRMRKEIVAHCVQGGAGLKDTVREAVASLASN